MKPGPIPWNLCWPRSSPESTALLEYFEIVDPEQLQPVAEITGPVRAAGAIWVGSTRLIDNLLCVPMLKLANEPAPKLAAEPAETPVKEGIQA